MSLNTQLQQCTQKTNKTNKKINRISPKQLTKHHLINIKINNLNLNFISIMTEFYELFTIGFILNPTIIQCFLCGQIQPLY